MNIQNVEEFTNGKSCENLLLNCYCACPYCGERDDCECRSFDAALDG